MHTVDGGRLAQPGDPLHRRHVVKLGRALAKRRDQLERGQEISQRPLQPLRCTLLRAGRRAEQLLHAPDVGLLGDAVEDGLGHGRHHRRLDDHPAAQHPQEIHHAVRHVAGLEREDDGGGEPGVGVCPRDARLGEGRVQRRDGRHPVVERLYREVGRGARR